MARPGGNASAFWLPKTMASGRILRRCMSTAPTAVTPSTNSNGSPLARTASAISSMGLSTPVDDSFETTVMASASGLILPSMCSLRTALPQVASMRSTSFPFRVPICCQRSPKEPLEMPIIFLCTPQRTHDSRNPVAEAGGQEYLQVRVQGLVQLLHHAMLQVLIVLAPVHDHGTAHRLQGVREHLDWAHCEQFLSL